MASQSMNCAVRNASTSLVPTNSPYGIKKYECTTPGATSLQATTYRAGSIGANGSLHPSREVRDPSALLAHGHWRRIAATMVAELTED
jgi:hypothetical protein